MSYFRWLYPTVLFFTGIALIIYSNVFYPDVTISIDSIRTELDDLRERVITNEIAPKQTVKNVTGDSSSINKTIHAEVLEVIRAERNVYELILENERYVRNFLISGLGVFLAAIGLFGVIGVQHVVKKITEVAERELSLKINCKYAVAQGTLFNHIGYFQYAQYCKDRNSGSQQDTNGLLLKSAISSAHHAVRSFDGIPEGVLLDVNKGIKYRSMMNLSYYLADKNDSKDSREALWNADQVHAIARARKVDEWYNWEESYAYVLYRFGLEHQKQYAFELVDKLVSDIDIEDLEWKKSVKEEWDGRKTNPAQPSLFNAIEN